MLLPEERALVTDLQDKIISLLVERQEAWADGNAVRVERLQRDINRLRAECAAIRQCAEEHVCC
ncbi:MAG TPA: hypothetical protein VGR45_18030 [Stellaceae bacterium]|nr:hypothetical protein [Stellaceae bacterium]